MATETLFPDAILTQTGLVGSVTDIDEDPDSPDANWLTTNASNGVLDVSFPTPTGSPDTGAGVQEFRVLLRKDAAAGGDPDVIASLRESAGGTDLQVLATNVLVTSSTGTVLSWTWDASNLGTPDGSSVVLHMTFQKGGGGPNERNVEVGAIEWNVTYTGAVLESITGSTTGTSTDSGTLDVVNKAYLTSTTAGTSTDSGTLDIVNRTYLTAATTGTSTDQGLAFISDMVHGTVTLTGSPVENALVYVIDQTTDLVTSTQTTNANGQYSFGSLSAGTYHVVVESASGVAPSVSDVIIS